MTDERRVSKGHVIQYGGGLYEAPRGLARQKVLVHRHVLSGELSLLLDERFVRLHPVDLALNARDRRGQRPAEPPARAAPVKTTATLAFEHDYTPVGDVDGGFHDRE